MRLTEEGKKIMKCLFCSIIKGDIPSARVFENDDVYAFKDIHPSAPVHVLVIPKRHIDSLDAIGTDGVNFETAAKTLKAIPEVAKACGLTNGYRVITNVGGDGCQSVKHLHFHILGGVKLAEKLN